MTRLFSDHPVSGAVSAANTRIAAQRVRSGSLRYGLRAMLVFVTLVAIGLAWIAHRGHVQREAVAIVTQWGGTVEYDNPSMPVWLTTLAGKDCFCTVWKVDLSGTKVTDRDLVQLKPLTDLYTLDLAGTKVTDGAMRHLRTFTELRWVRLERTAVSERGAGELRSALPNARVYLEDPADQWMYDFDRE